MSFQKIKTSFDLDVDQDYAEALLKTSFESLDKSWEKVVYQTLIFLGVVVSANSKATKYFLTFLFATTDLPIESISLDEKSFLYEERLDPNFFKFDENFSESKYIGTRTDPEHKKWLGIKGKINKLMKIQRDSLIRVDQEIDNIDNELVLHIVKNMALEVPFMWQEHLKKLMQTLVTLFEVVETSSCMDFYKEIFEEQRRKCAAFKTHLANSNAFDFSEITSWLKSSQEVFASFLWMGGDKALFRTLQQVGLPRVSNIHKVLAEAKDGLI